MKFTKSVMIFDWNYFSVECDILKQHRVKYAQSFREDEAVLIHMSQLWTYISSQFIFCTPFSDQ